MIQASGDNDGENQGSHPQPRPGVQHISDEPQPQDLQQAQVQVQQITIAEQQQCIGQPSVTLALQIHPQRQTTPLAETVSQTVNVIAAPVATGTTSSTPQATSIESATYQHYLIPNVSLGGHVQSIAKPTHVAMSVQQSIRASGAPVVQAMPSAPTYTITPPQNLARILAAANQGYTLCAGNRSASPGASTAAQVQAIITGAPLSSQNIQIQRSLSTTTAILTVPVVTATMAQRTITGSVRQDAVAVHLAAPAGTGNVVHQQQQSHQGEVTRLHSYSLASASTVTHSSAANVSSPGSQNQGSTLRTASGHAPVLCEKKDNLASGDSNVPCTQTSVLQKRTYSALSSPVSVNISSNNSSSSSSVSSSCSNMGVNIVNTCVSVPGSSILLSPVPNSPLCSPKPKRIKLEEKPPANENIANMRKKICDYRFQELKSNKENYIEHLTELFFLQNGGNMMDYLPWKRRCTPQLLAFLKANALDSDDDDDVFLPLTKPPTSQPVVPALTSQSTATPHLTQSSVVREIPTPSPKPPLTTVVTSSHSTPTVSQVQGSSTNTIMPRNTSPSTHNVALPSAKSPKTALIALPTNRLPTRQHSISAVYDSSIGSQEEIVERAKQEAYVMQRIAELRKEGLWSAKKLPKLAEPLRPKAHWDYLLEEMRWLATDFAQEQKWKKAAAKKFARLAMKYHQEKEMKAERQEKEELLRLKKIAGQMAKEIKQFWSNIEKLVEYKTQTRLEEKRKKALDIHLNFIVDQTEKYSSWLTRGMNKSVLDSAGVSGASSAAQDSQPPSPAKSPTSSNDDDFEPDHSESDDEETIAKEEAEDMNALEQKQEIEILQKESELPLEELLKDLPPDILEKPASPLLSRSSESGSEEADSEHEQQPMTRARKRKRKSPSISSGDNAKNQDEEFCVDSDEGVEDDEATMEEQEAKEEGADYRAELKELQEEGEMSIEELYKKYADAYASDFEMPESSESDDNVEDDEDEEKSAGDANEYADEARGSDADDEEEEEEEDMDSDDEDAIVDVGMEYLIHPEKDEVKSEKKEEKLESTSEKGPGKEITDIAAAAESFQPKGNTFSTTQVFTTVPFLLKHSLREYQHIGLDWLVAMYDKKLNGILADEMGLGKTIQTIALLAHLACDKGIWGPHLIVVPTSVMLNWEMEFKKWCPAFKILTYYGSQKERRQKRQGWTKPNAFHVCITSYKLVIQDHQSFRRKKWKYFILDEAQHIKNFKSQRWQMLLNFQSSRRLLLTGTPLQNSLMELWSLMHFLMPNVFQSHREFRDWFANPVTGMIEGSHEYSDSLIKRLHKVLRPFLLRRLKSEVEKQLPKKYEHVVMCRLSKRQRYLYDDFMSQAKTKETLAGGNFLSVINVLMQLRKVCNHPNLFEPRPTVSPFMMEGICFYTSSLVWRAIEYDPLRHVSLWALNLLLVDLELCLTAFAAHRIKKFQTTARFIEEIDCQPPPPPKCPPGKIRLHIRTSTSSQQTSSRMSPAASPNQPRPATPGTPFRPSPQARPIASPVPQPVAAPQKLMVLPASQSAPPKPMSPAPATLSQGLVGSHAPIQPTEYTLQLIQQPSAGGIPVAQLTSLSGGSQVVTPTSITVQIQPAGQSGARLTMPLGVGRLVQTTTGQHLLLTSTAVSGSPLEGQSQQLQQLATSAVLLTTPSSTVSSSSSLPVHSAIISTATVASAGSTGTVLSNHIPLAPKAQLTTAGVAKPQVVISSVSSAASTLPQAKQFVTSVANVHPTVLSTPKVQSALTASLKSAVSSPIKTMPAAPSKVQPSVPLPSKPPAVVTPILTTSTAKPILRAAPISTNQQSSVNRSHTVVTPHKPMTRTDSSKLAVKDELKRMKSIFYMESLQQKRQAEYKQRLEHLGRINTHRCAACPIYGRDLIEAVTMIKDVRPCTKGRPWGGMGYVHCLNAPYSKDSPRQHWYFTHTLVKLIHTPQSLLEELEDIISRFVFVIPVVTAPRIQMHMSHPPPSKAESMASMERQLQQELSPLCSMLHDIMRNTCTQFPELRLIQYDCGKLQTLDKLLWKLKSEGHRALIFTQMTRMLDVLEQFLNYHGHTYLRLDGNTRVDQRQALMERFNADKRIFCFILSTRSGGIGVNLTGADTVIFYDSDWNPTMDAQAQDRCHRIGQTRDVHIYRLISDRTVEENILKKANQKRLLGDLAIEGGNFTTAFFKTNAIQELFGIEVSDKSSGTIKGEEAASSFEDTASKGGDVETYSSAQLEQALGMAEEENDIIAARTARAEAAAELAEFDETVPLDTDSKDMEEKSPAEEELEKLMEQLTPVEKYAMQFLESIQEPFSLEQLKQAEEEIEAQKKDWELGHLKALKEEEERLSALLEDQEEPLLCYSREDAYNQVAKSSKRLTRGGNRRSKSKEEGAKQGSLNKRNSYAPRRRSTRLSSRKNAAGNESDDKDVTEDEARSKVPIKLSNHIHDRVLLDKQSKQAVNERLSSSCNVEDVGTRGSTTRAASKSPRSFHRSPITSPKQGQGSVKCTSSSSSSSLGGSTPTVPQPFSNPNLVIRTRRASAREAEASKHRADSDSEVDIITVGPKESLQALTNSDAGKYAIHKQQSNCNRAATGLPKRTNRTLTNCRNCCVDGEHDSQNGI